MSSFLSFELLPSLQSTLEKLGFTSPTEIQERTIPGLLQGNSMVGIAETGSGKTLAYALPVLDSLKRLETPTSGAGDPVAQPGRPRAVILVPTSDLGEQVAKVFKDFTHETRLRVRVVVGGKPLAVARRSVAGPFEILLASPGRLEQLLDLKLLDLSDVRALVFDEADEILERGFISTVKRLQRTIPPEAQLALFSATASKEVQALIAAMFKQAGVVETRGHHRVTSTLKTINKPVPDGKRFPVLEEILAKETTGCTLMFTNTREQCDKLMAELSNVGYPAAMYRGDMDKKERRSNLQRFREGEVRLLVCTDLAARGLDLENVDRVINYHLPRDIKVYLHRAGRTARAGRGGVVVNLVTKRDSRLVERLRSIEALGGG